MSRTSVRVWTVAVADRGVVEHVRAFPTQAKAQKDLAAHLRRYHEYPGSHKMEELSEWLDQHSERISAQVMCQRLNLGIDSASSRLLTPGLLISPPPEERTGGELLYRVVYVIDVHASDTRKAAEVTHRLMTDPDSMRPVLEVIDPKGNVTTIDLSEEKGGDKPCARSPIPHVIIDTSSSNEDYSISRRSSPNHQAR